MERILQHYSVAWKRPRVALVGYSFGADILPFVFNRLRDDVRSKVELVALLAPTNMAEFEFHLSDWVGGESDTALPTAPEISKIAGTRVLCVQGGEEETAACTSLRKTQGKTERLPGGHHFDGDYVGLAARILAELKTAQKHPQLTLPTRSSCVRSAIVIQWLQVNRNPTG